MEKDSTKPKQEPTMLVRRDGSTALSWGPARGSWEVFQPGNVCALKHGANSSRLVSARVVEVREHVAGLSPWTEDDPVELARFCSASARERLLHDYIVRAVGTEEGLRGISSHALASVNRASGVALRGATRLGLNPLGRARRLREARQKSRFPKH